MCALLFMCFVLCAFSLFAYMLHVCMYLYVLATEMHVYVTNVLFYCMIVFYVIVGKKLT